MSSIIEEGVPLTLKAWDNVVSGSAISAPLLVHGCSGCPRTPLASTVVVVLFVRLVIIGVVCGVSEV